MGSIAHILSPMSAAWCGWTMMALFLCAVFSEVMQPGVITQSPLSILARTERTYKDAPTNTLGQILISIFRIGTLAMAICLCFYAGGAFRFGTFAAVCGLIIAFILVKMLCNMLLDYTFMLSRRFMPIYEQYGDLATISSCALYPCLLIFIRIGQPELSRWALGIIAGAFVLVCLYRMARIYIQSLSAILYVALYVATMELVPFGALLYLSSKMIACI